MKKKTNKGEWKKYYLKNLINGKIKNGYSPVCPKTETGKWILSLGCLKESKFDLSQLKPAPEDDQKLERFLLKKGDFLISRSNTPDKVGRVILFRGEINNCYFPDLLMRFRVDEEKIFPDYLEHFLRSNLVRKYIERRVNGTSRSMVKINREIVNKIPVIIPELNEQKAIAETITLWDEAIDKIEKLIYLKENEFKWLLDELITKPSLYKDFQKNGWKRKKLSELSKIKKGKQLNKNNMIADGEYFVINGGQKPSGKTNDFNVSENSITISEGGNSCGYINFIKEKFWAGGHCYYIDDIKFLKKYYLFYFLKAFEKRIMNLRVGSGLPNIQANDIKNFIVFFPNEKIQIEISELLNKLSGEIYFLKKLNEKYRMQKRGLSQKLLTGKIRLKVLNEI